MKQFEINFMDFLEQLSLMPLPKTPVPLLPTSPVKPREAPTDAIENFTNLLKEESLALHEFYTALTWNLNKIKKKIIIYDDGRWLYFKNFKGKLWFDPERSIYAGYFAEKIPNAPTWVSNKTYTVKIGCPEYKTLIIKKLLEEYPDKIEYKYIGDEYYPNIKKVVFQILKRNEPIHIKAFRIRQLYELACSKAPLNPALLTREELEEEIKQQKENVENIQQNPIKKLTRWLKCLMK